MAQAGGNQQSEEAVALTLAMRDSGSVLSWDEFDGPILDKHSTGGVGDNVSLMLAPAIAALGRRPSPSRPSRGGWGSVLVLQRQASIETVMFGR